GGVPGSGSRLVFRGELAQAIVGTLHLIDHAAAAGSAVAGEQVRPPTRVVGGLMAAHLPIDAGPQVGDRVHGRSPEHIETVAVYGTVAVRHRLGLAQGIDRVGILLAGAGATGVLIGVPHGRQDIVRVDIAAGGRRDAVDVARDLDGS